MIPQLYKSQSQVRYEVRKNITQDTEDWRLGQKPLLKLSKKIKIRTKSNSRKYCDDHCLKVHSHSNFCKVLILVPVLYDEHV